MKTFWTWWSFIITTLCLVFIGEYYLNFSHYIFVLDTTGISIFILLITAVCSLYLGWLSYMLRKKNKFTYLREYYFQPAWFCSDTVLSIGMLGTLIGFLMVLTTAFSTIDTSSPEQMKQVISQLASGMGVALVTSITGLISSILLKIQLVLLEVDNERT